VYLSPPPDNNWRDHPPWSEEKRPGFRLISQLNTNSDSALHTSAMNPNPQDPFSMNQQMGHGPPQRNSVNEAEVDGSGDFSFPALPNEEGLIGVSKPLPKQLWEAKKIFPSPEPNPGLSHYQGSLNTGGSLPDLTNLHFPSPLSTPLDPEDNGGYPNLSGGSSTGNLPAAMMHLGISNSQLSSSLSNPTIQASLNNCQLQSSLSNPSINSSLRLSGNSPRRRPAPISPLTLSPGAEQRRGLSKQLSPTMSPSLSPITQGVALDTSNMPREPPPPYPLYQQSQHAVDQAHQCQQHNNFAPLFSDSFMEQQFSSRHNKTLPYQSDQFSMLENAMNSTGGGSFFDPSLSSLYSSQSALAGLGGSHGNLHEPRHMASSMLYSNCSGGLPNIILTESNPSLSKDISGVLSTVPECFDSEGGFPLEDELHIEPLSLDGLSMLSDPDMVLPDPSVEDTFRSDRL
uniref:CREB regulated transcription coactivator 3 n=1 Tax=Hippocampus comes TaxID=109280 RepID=A0A3Q2YPZ7_HIPCM